MKVLTESSLPVRPHGMAERYALNSIESSARYLPLSMITFAVWCLMWWLRQEPVFGFVAAANLVHVIHGWQARMLLRMICRAASPKPEQIAPANAG